MIKLINRGKYEKAVQDEFEHLTNRLSTFLGQIFDENGIYIPPDGGGGDLNAIVSTVRRTKYGDLFISNGSQVGFSTLPWAVDVNKTLLSYLGTNQGGSAPGQNFGITFETGSNIRLKGYRTGTPAFDATIFYCVMEFW